jgi:hypothetical protein
MVKCFTSRGINCFLSGFFQFMGDTMQPANHRAVRVEDTRALHYRRHRRFCLRRPSLVLLPLLALGVSAF